MVYFANCHLHSDISDSFLSPEKIVDIAKELGHKALVLTDHDTVKGSHRFDVACRKAGIYSMLGIEFITKGLGTGFHLLGYDFDAEHPAMRELIDRCSSRHRERCHLLFEESLGNGSLRPGVTWQEVLDAFPGNDFYYYTQVFTVLEKKGIYEHAEHPQFIKDAFSPPKDREPELEAAIGYFTPDIEECIKVILAAGGVPVIAHPHGKQEYIEDLIKMGIKGIEVYDPSITEEERIAYDALCRERGLYVTGGTDHAGKIGGFTDLFEKKNKPDDCGGLGEEDFFRLYRRELG